MHPEWRTIEVVSRVTGHRAKATVLVCLQCDGTRWNIFRVGAGEHEHYQCVDCGATYCDSSCASD